MDVVAVVAARERIRVERAVRVEAVDEFRPVERSGYPARGDSEAAARSRARASAELTVDGPNVDGAPERVVRDVPLARVARDPGGKR
jgi:hypothetical protein